MLGIFFEDCQHAGPALEALRNHQSPRCYRHRVRARHGVLGVLGGLAVVASACTSNPLDDAFDDAIQVPNVSSLSVWRDGAVVREAYDGGDASTTHDARPGTKHVTP